MERVLYNGTIKPNLATNSAARSFIVSVDPNSNNAVSWDRGYHFNDVNTSAPVHSNGLTSSKITGSSLGNGINSTGSWNATHNNTWTLNELANAQIDPYSYMGTTYDPVHAVDLVIYPGSASTVQALSTGYAGYNSSTSWAYFLQPAGNPGAVWAQRAFTSLPYYDSNLLNATPTTLYSTDVSPAIPKSQALYMNRLSFPDSITSYASSTRTVSSYTVVSGYTVPNVTISPFKMLLAVINNQGNWAYCHIPLHVTSGDSFTFRKNPDNYRRFELVDRVYFNAYLDRECLRVCQNYLKAGISAGSFNGSTKSYFPMLSWDYSWHFPYVTEGGTSEALLSNYDHAARFRVNWSPYIYDRSKYQVSNIEQIQ